VLAWADGGARLAVFVWGVSFPVLKGIMTVMDPLALMLVRGFVSSLVPAAILRRTGGWRWPARGELPELLTVGLVGFTLNQIRYSMPTWSRSSPSWPRRSCSAGRSR
jgi:drug/metabolite transporter (DMT)-like permease